MDKILSQVICVSLMVGLCGTWSLVAAEPGVHDDAAIQKESVEVGLPFGQLVFEHPVTLLAVQDFSVATDSPAMTNLDMDELAQEDKDKSLAELRKGMALPAVLLLESLSNGKDLHILFYDEEGSARKVLTLALSRHYKDGGGFSSFDHIQIVRDASQSEIAFVAVTQTSIPSKKDRPFMPGPPITRVYRYDGEKQVYDKGARK